ncbi:MAG: RND family transporter, partial [Emergencia sp.]
MRTFYTHVVRHRKLILCFFFCLAAVCALLQNLISVNYDMNDYLPKDSHSTVSLNVMEQEFTDGIPGARVMIKDVTIPQALDYKEKLEAVDGVTDVKWLDDIVDVRVPLGTCDASVTDDYYKDDTAIFTVTIDEEKRMEAVSAIRHLTDDRNYMSGNTVTTVYATERTVSEIARIAFIAVIFVFFVLLLTTRSWLDPVILLTGLGVAIVINAGSNLIFGEISFVTNAAGNILQLAVSLDYSVFLLHRFEECREAENDPEKAMIDALCKSTSSILSSGLTTVIGFLALTLMRFRIGPDMGLALAKGIAISLLTVFLFMPALMLVTFRFCDRFRHKALLPDFRGFGRFVRKVTLPLCLVLAVTVVPAYLASTSNSYFYGSSHIFAEGTLLGGDIEAIEDVYGQKDTYVLMVPKETLSQEKALSEELNQIPEIDSIISYVDTVGAEIPSEYLNDDILSQLRSENYDRLVLTVSADYEGEHTFRLIEEIHDVAQKYYPDSYYLAGEGVSTYDLMKTVTSDMTRVNLVAIAAVLLVLIVTMRSLLLPVILVLSIESAIWINLSFPYLLDAPVFYIAYLIISSIQLGATVDYAILMTSRYKENREISDRNTALIETVRTVTVPILTSGSVLTVVGFLLGYISTHQLLAQLGIFVGRGALCSLFVVLLVLPGLLYLFDRFIIRDRNRVKGSNQK